MAEVPAGAAPDLAEKLGRLRDVAAARGAGRLVLRRPATLAWLLGARVHVPQTLDAACLDVVVHVDGSTVGVEVVTNAIEAPRLRDRELAGLAGRDTTWTVVPWTQGRAAALPTGPDVADEDDPQVAAALAQVRCVLTGHQQQALRRLAADATAATADAAGHLDPGMSGHRAAGLLAARLLDVAADPVVLLVGGTANAFRHPLPTTDPVGDLAMLVCCARRHGLVASVTRLVAFRPPTAQESDAYTRLLHVEAAFLDATRSGARLGDVVTAGMQAYGRNGFDPDEWQRHHQGGLTGVAPREYPAGPGSAQVLRAGHAVAWNPSAGPWKVEDTCLVGDDGPRPLDVAPGWPTERVAGRDRPGVLVR